MTAHTDFVLELAKDITDAVASENWDSVRTDLTAVSEQIVQALMERRDEDVSRTYDIVERAYSTLVTRCRLDDNVSDASTAAAELRAYTRLLSVALQYRKSPSAKETALDQMYRPLLEALLRAPRGLSGRELAAEIETRPETIARKLPVLRSAGLVQSQQVGKATNNTITREGRTLLDREHAERAAAASLTGNVVAAKTVSLDLSTLGAALRSFKHRHMHQNAVHEVRVVRSSHAKDTNVIANLIVEPAVAEGLARINEAVATKVGPIEDLTIHFYPKERRVVANLDQMEIGEATMATVRTR